MDRTGGEDEKRPNLELRPRRALDSLRRRTNGESGAPCSAGDRRAIPQTRKTGFFLLANQKWAIFRPSRPTNKPTRPENGPPAQTCSLQSPQAGGARGCLTYRVSKPAEADYRRKRAKTRGQQQHTRRTRNRRFLALPKPVYPDTAIKQKKAYVFVQRKKKGHRQANI
ncbi:hypothetical protein KL912_002486 [Ogataea haglerorum]|nr:hypothetical protein KL912_002486 [Ogataea haglerorum]